MGEGECVRGSWKKKKKRRGRITEWENKNKIRKWERESA
jgi:hypothetical protein